MAQSIKSVAVHYWHGSKLLVADVKIACKLIGQLGRGRTLTRREHNLLVRVLADVLRLIPLAIFVLVPFMEFALPFAIRLFPNMLPSTFEEKHVKEEKRKKLLKVRLGVLQVLEHTLEERAKQQMKSKRDGDKKSRREGEAREGDASADGAPRSGSGTELRDFMGRLHEGGHASSWEELLRMMAMFKDQLTLDAMNRQVRGTRAIRPRGTCVAS